MRPSETATSAVGTAAPFGPPELGHRAHVLALGRRGPLVAGAEEPDRELGLGLRRGHRDVAGGDRGGGGDVPGDLAVGLDEVRVAVGRRVEGVEGGRLELDVLPLGRREQRPVGGLAVEPVDAQVAEQPLGVGLARADSTAGRCGSPAPTTISGAPCWDSSWQAAQSAETSSGCTSCISSMNSAIPMPTSAATAAASMNSSTRSISMSPESARPVAAGTSMPGCQRSRTFASADSPQGERLEHAEELLDRLRSRCRGASSRTAMCSAEETGRRSDWSGRASILPVPQPREIAAERSGLSSTVLPTPRRPVSTS